MTREQQLMVRLVRVVCAREFDMPVDSDFFYADRRLGETTDQCLLRVFQAARATEASDTDAINVLVHG